MTALVLGLWKPVGVVVLLGYSCQPGQEFVAEKVKKPEHEGTRRVAMSPAALPRLTIRLNCFVGLLRLGERPPIHLKHHPGLEFVNGEENSTRVLAVTTTFADIMALQPKQTPFNDHELD